MDGRLNYFSVLVLCVGGRDTAGHYSMTFTPRGFLLSFVSTSPGVRDPAVKLTAAVPSLWAGYTTTQELVRGSLKPTRAFPTKPPARPPGSQPVLSVPAPRAHPLYLLLGDFLLILYY